MPQETIHIAVCCVCAAHRLSDDTWTKEPFETSEPVKFSHTYCDGCFEDMYGKEVADRIRMRAKALTTGSEGES